MICFRNVAILLLVVGFTACSSAYGSEKTSLQINDYEKGLEAFANGNTEIALYCLFPLAEQGHANAQNTLGDLYSSSDYGIKSNKSAMKWFTLAAKQELFEAQKQLGSKLEMM